MKLNEKIVGKVADSIKDDLAKIAEEQSERLLRALDEQVRGGGEPSIALKVDVVLTDKGASEQAVEVQTKFGFVRRVKDEDVYIPHVIDLGDTLFDHAKRKAATGKDAAAGE